jgi:thiol:disulfide interchange protein DsbG
MQKKRLVKSMFMALGVSLSLSAMAATDWKKIMTSRGNKVVKEFSSPSGFRGLVVEAGGAEKTFYVTENGDYLFSGELFGEDGLPLSQKSVAPKSAPDWNRIMQGKGNNIVKEFRSSSGFKGLVVERNGSKKIFYVTANGKFLAAGEVFNSAGGSITKIEMAEQAGVAQAAPVAAPGLSPAQASEVDKTVSEQSKMLTTIRELETVPTEFKNKVFAAAEKSTAWVEEGSGNNIVYVIFDPICPHCHKTWEMLRPYVQRGLLRVRWIPVISLSGNNMQSPSAQMAAYFLLNRGETDIVEKMFRKTIKSVAPDDRMARSLSQNLLFLRDTKFRGTPLLIYQRGGERNAFIVPEQPEVEQIERMIRKN